MHASVDLLSASCSGRSVPAVWRGRSNTFQPSWSAAMSPLFTRRAPQRFARTTAAVEDADVAFNDLIGETSAAVVSANDAFNAVEVGSGVEALIAKAGQSLLSASPEALFGAGAVAALALGTLVWALTQGGQGSYDKGEGSSQQEGKGEVAEKLPREKAVLVFGASGRTGALVVQQLVGGGRTVVAAGRSGWKVRGVLEQLGVKEGRQAGEGQGILFVEGGVDVTDESTLGEALFQGVAQVVSALGPVYGEVNGARGYIDGMSPARVDAAGVKAVVEATKKALGQQVSSRATFPVLSMASLEDLEKWKPLDDVIMGGKSGSSLAVKEDGSGVVWSGELVVEGGGFCGTRTEPLDLDLSGYDGIVLRVKGDGQTFKMNLKTADQADVPEATYQATFDTQAGDWTYVYLPWHCFVATKRAKFDPLGAPVDPAKIRQFGLVLSRFEYNGFPQPNYKEGPFQLEIQGGIQAFKDPRPVLVLVSSAGVERNALVGDNAEARKKEIPIVQLNPGGILNYKYEGECVVRTSGLPYSIIRATGLSGEVSPELKEPALLEADQEDKMSGTITRAELAEVVAAALGSPLLAGKTFSVRRGLGPEAQGKSMTPPDYVRLSLKLAPDSQRTHVGLPPFPAPVPYTPPPPTSPPKEPAPAEASNNGAGPANVVEARAWISSWRNKAAAEPEVPASDNGAGPAVGAGGSADVAARKESAQAWIAAWRGKGGADAGGSVVEAGVAGNVADAREWIRSWRAQQLEVALGLPVHAQQ